MGVARSRFGRASREIRRGSISRIEENARLSQKSARDCEKSREIAEFWREVAEFWREIAEFWRETQWNS